MKWRKMTDDEFRESRPSPVVSEVLDGWISSCGWFQIFKTNSRVHTRCVRYISLNLGNQRGAANFVHKHRTWFEAARDAAISKKALCL